LHRHPADSTLRIVPAPQPSAPAPTIDGPLVGGFAAWLGATLLAAARWKVVLVRPVPDRCVIVFYPHTTNWDTPIGLCVRFMTGLSINFAGKDSLFRVPIVGPLLRRWGGVPVNRRERTGFIEEIEAQFREHGIFRFAIAPEGTRGRTEYWKSGFYHLAREAGVPLALGYIDYPKHEIGVGAYVELTGDLVADMAKLRAFYADKRGLYPERQSPIVLRDERAPAG
jgi:1-acyl-sn-glycerol-3-phosphate acyltransferase